ncbi:MBOAT, membrane-bound O-acyltransferase family-domain-containing protein [Kickxella alabastrina]|uniref:MBOAT, membrane-bound O-acyltransferase family-domain-containing protein n=1 Tax=Kickxella alabastrina TaxID=61397 RepID=UPI00221EE82B|nr:MBOAT, membrane-bound O-acyltransferase family-domain-containing protein [Kickxella alabastrina]KAI7826285.1 MBOAT, membrane-bound O-acyltransferase family-domain-containing protein [Kickxella alabastrina]
MPRPATYQIAVMTRFLHLPSRESKSRGKRKPVQIFFRPQTSILDYTELMYQGSDRMRGLVTCFWTIVGAYLVSLLASHYESNGEIMSLSLGSLIFSRGMDLMLSDLALVVSTAFVVPLVRICWVGWQKPGIFDPHSRQSMAIQALAEIIWLVVWYSWQGTRGWPWSQRCFFALHTMVNWMKIHSLGLGDASLEAELCPYTVRFPANLTLGNYCMFQLCPTFVYELEYPRTTHIRWGYVLEKLAGTAAHARNGILLTTMHLTGPMATCWLLFFFITFDSIANGFAELTRFADRRFYDDWWNARGLDEFSRKWNRPVHMFLARHIYMPMRENWHIRDLSSSNKSSRGFLGRLRRNVPASVAAMAMTFFFSSILHEVTVVVACHRWNHGMFFFSQMMQIPLIIMSEKVLWFKSSRPALLCAYTFKAFEDRALQVNALVNVAVVAIAA